MGAPTVAVRGGGIGRVLREDPARVVDLPVFVGVGLAARLLAAWETRRGRTPSWGRDDTARR